MTSFYSSFSSQHSPCCWGGGGRSLEQERRLDWFDPAVLPWQQYERALLLLQAAWGVKRVSVCADKKKGGGGVQVHKI